MHLDVKPSTFCFRNNGSCLIELPVYPKHYDDTSNQTSSTPIGISKGYAPLEQYKQGGVKHSHQVQTFYSRSNIVFFFFYLLTNQQPPE